MKIILVTYLILFVAIIGTIALLTWVRYKRAERRRIGCQTELEHDMMDNDMFYDWLKNRHIL